ncbi:diaminobutyrate acetyltransferase [Brevibacterium linens]|jgi:L-2,4-diaminobutyric acid acetyltransferase|uniref:diaminobutyrate acetyltransferase n=1 Tax=Brevibacterium linens TaxID=1703 RepID=UPI000FCBC1CA|nr:diaminobutyrate acetyltransferase [Brevibacterium linens]AZT99943.1 diaminobutyrate acetyltransferase [Brevibacterium linens]
MSITHVATATEVSPETPTLKDAASMWSLVRSTPEVDQNSAYYYMIWCRDFMNTTRVVRHEGEVAAFITGYIQPDAPDTLMIWQQVISPAFRGTGLGICLLRSVAEPLIKSSSIQFVEATVSAVPSPPARTLEKLGALYGAPVASTELFSSSMFPDSDHGPEILVRVGPIGSVLMEGGV